MRIDMTPHSLLFGFTLFLSAAAYAGEAAPAGAPPHTSATLPKDFKQEKRALTPGEQRAVARLNAASVGLVQRYVPGVREEAITARTLDRAYAAWLKDARADKPDADKVVPAFGVRMGTLAIASCKGGHWLHVKDNYGEAVAVAFGDTGRQVYPLDSVNKRYSRGEEGFFADLDALYQQACNDTLK